MNRMKNYITIIFLSFIISNVHGQVTELSLSAAIEKALESNYGIIISKTDVTIAEINNDWANTGRYPSINFSASDANSYSLTDQSSNVRLSAGLGLNWTIFNGFKANITKAKLDQLEILAKGRSTVVIESTIQDIILTYYNILLQKEELKVLQKVMKLSEDRYEYEKARHELGGTVSYNVLQAKNLYLNDKSNYMNQEVTYNNSVRNLNFLLGTDPYAYWNLTEGFQPDTLSYNLSDLYEKMISNNSTLQNQYVNGVIQKKETELLKSNLYPSINFSTGIDNSYTMNSSSGNSSAVSPYGNISLSFSFFTGGVRKKAIEVAKINENISDIETSEMKHSLTNQLYNEYDIYNLRKNLLLVATESLEASEISLKIAEEKYKTGAINSFNYRDIQLNYLNTAQLQLQAIYNLVYSKTSLTRLTGGFMNKEN